MIPFVVTILFVSAAWNVIVWPRFYKRVAADPRARDSTGRATVFLRVHAVLVGVSLLLSLLMALGAVLLLVA